MSRSLILRWAACLAALAAAALLGPPLLGFSAFVADEALSRWRHRVEWNRTHATLAQPLTVDGAVLPAGAEVEWDYPSQSRVAGAHLPQPVEILGVRTVHLYRDGDGGWIIYALEPRELDGWSCAEGHVQLTAQGRLRGCALSRATSWRGWALPERTQVDPIPSIRAVRLTLPYSTPLEMPLESPVVGRLPWLVMLNDDGSPSDADYEPEAPYVIAGRKLSGDVRWQYDPATYGMGRERLPITVSGFVSVPDGAGGVAKRHVVLPWNGSFTRARAD